MEMIGAAVGQIVPCYGSNDHVAKPQALGRLGDALRLVILDVFRVTARYRAKSTWPRAGVAQDHERGRPVGVTLRPIETAGILADRLQAQLTEQAVGKEVAVAAWQVVLQPGRQSPNRRWRIHDFE